MNSIRLSGFLAVGLLLICGSAHVSAQPVISGTYYEENAGINCSVGNCELQFTATPSKVLFTRLECSFLNFPTQIYLVDLSVRDTPTGGDRRTSVLALGPPITTTGGNRYYTMNASLEFMFAPSRIPNLRTFTDGPNIDASVQCKLTGRIQS